MSDDGYLPGIAIATVMTLVAWLLVLFYFDPATAGVAGIILFFVSFSATLVGALMLLFSFVRHRFVKEPASFGTTVRQACLLGVAVSGILLLQALDKLNWWNGVAIVVAVLVVESYALIKPE